MISQPEFPKTADFFSIFRTLEREHGEWADATFPGETMEQKIKHLRSEVKELLAKPTDSDEIADCFLLVLNIARTAKVDVLAAGRAKFEVCKKRKWAKQHDGTIHHVKE